MSLTDPSLPTRGEGATMSIQPARLITQYWNNFKFLSEVFAIITCMQ